MRLWRCLRDSMTSWKPYHKKSKVASNRHGPKTPVKGILQTETKENSRWEREDLRLVFRQRSVHTLYFHSAHSLWSQHHCYRDKSHIQIWSTLCLNPNAGDLLQLLKSQVCTKEQMTHYSDKPIAWVQSPCELQEDKGSIKRRVQLKCPYTDTTNTGLTRILVHLSQ